MNTSQNKAQELKYCHRDCWNFAAIDVAKGLCHVTKQQVTADDPTCSTFNRIAKCRWCNNFKTEGDTMETGLCMASLNEPKFPAYPDMVAVTCENFSEV